LSEVADRSIIVSVSRECQLAGLADDLEVAATGVVRDDTRRVPAV
jgi:hypothetical protein